MPENREREPMLDIARGDRALSRHLRRSLEALRERTDDRDFRRQIDDILAGRVSLRNAAFTGTFERGLTPHFKLGMQRWQEVSEEERERLAEEGRAAFDRLNAEIEAEGRVGSGGDAARAGSGTTGGRVGSGGAGTGAPAPPVPASSTSDVAGRAAAATPPPPPTATKSPATPAGFPTVHDADRFPPPPDAAT